MSTNTIASDIIAEHDAKQRKQPPPTPKEVHARMIEMTNAANGLRYELARFGDIERQLKAIHEKMEPLVLKAKELNDLICERVSQASQPWADSRIHESEELLQKVQHLERELATEREWAERYRLVTLRQDAELAELREQLEDVKRVRYSLEDSLTRSQAEAESCWGKKERLADAAEEVLRTCINFARVTSHPCPENLVICRQLRAAIDAARAKEAKP